MSEEEEEEVIEKVSNNDEFKVLLNGEHDVLTKLEDFKKACDAHERRRRKRPKRRYYSLGLIAKLVPETTDEEMRLLLRHGARTFLIDTVQNRPQELELLVQRAYTAFEEFQQTEIGIQVITSLAMEINGDCCRMGRMRNNSTVMLERGSHLTLTTNESYKYSCFKEIAYVINLKYYMTALQLRDVIRIGKMARGRVLKRLKENVTIEIEQPGVMNSYNYVELPNQCYMIKQEKLAEMFMNDLELAVQAKASFIVISKIRCKPFLQALVDNFKPFKLIGSPDFEYLLERRADVVGILKLLDYLWINNMFTANITLQQFICEFALPAARKLKLPVIGSVPLERCSDFKYFENHDFLWKIDTMFIQKSEWCKKYPLIVKKLLPVRDFHVAVVEDAVTVKSLLSSYRSIVNFIIRTISTIQCQVIIMHSNCKTAAEALARIEIYCPVLVMLPLEHEDEEECKINLVRALNLRRNLISVLYTKDMNAMNLKPLEYGIDYARKSALVESGDFIITLEIRKEDAVDDDPGVGDDVVILRALYLPHIKFADQLKQLPKP